ncbi:MAG: HEAT repeat domain-containing protein [Myxococcota bacterium]
MAGTATRRRKPRLFSFSREVEIGNFDEVVSDPEERHALEAVIDAFIEICRHQAVTPDTLLPVARGSRHASAYVRGVAITRLTVLTHYFDEAREVLNQVARDGDEEVRLYACAALPNTPDDVGVPLIGRALEDPSWRVRKAAAQAAGALATPALLPILDARLHTEPDARVKVQLQLAADFQRAASASP